MSIEKQIEEIAKDLCQNTFCSLEEWNKCKLQVGEYCANCRCMAERLYNAGYRKQSDVVRCKDCRYFFVYTDDDKADGNDVQGADGVCYMRVVNSDNRQFCACEYDDFCSFAKMKGGAEE